MEMQYTHMIDLKPEGDWVLEAVLVENLLI